jgi:hypothetical protein
VLSSPLPSLQASPLSYTEDRFNIGSPLSVSLLHEGHKAFLEQKAYSGQIEELADAE